MRSLTAISGQMEKIIRSRKQKHSVCLDTNIALPKSFENIFCVIAADDARRHGELNSAYTLMERCDNPILQQLWFRWCDHASRLRHSGRVA